MSANVRHQFVTELTDLAQRPVREFEPIVIEGWMSKWIAVSALHKSIRRGRVEKALQMADLLLRLDPQYFWRRLPVIALEDVGHGDPWVIARIGWACGKAQARAKIGDRDLALGLVARMASGAKDRITCDLTCLAREKPSLAWAALKLDLNEAVGILKDQTQDLLFRATVAISLVGGDLREDLPMRAETVSIPQVADLYAELGVDSEICLAIRWAGNRRQCGEMAAVLGLTAGLRIWSQKTERDPFFTEAPDIGPIPSAAFDQYTRQGLRAFAYFLKACAPVSEWMDEMRIEKNNRIKMLGRLVFRAEGDHLNPRLQVPAAYTLRDHYIKAVAEGYGIEAFEFLRGIELLRRNLSILNFARARILGLMD